MWVLPNSMLSSRTRSSATSSGPLPCWPKSRASPGLAGRSGFFHGYFASLTFGHPDPDQGKRDDETVIAAIVTNPRVMRQMPVLARDAGVEPIADFPQPPRRCRRGGLLASGY